MRRWLYIASGDAVSLDAPGDDLTCRNSCRGRVMLPELSRIGRIDPVDVEDDLAETIGKAGERIAGMGMIGLDTAESHPDHVALNVRPRPGAEALGSREIGSIRGDFEDQPLLKPALGLSARRGHRSCQSRDLESSDHGEADRIHQTSFGSLAPCERSETRPLSVPNRMSGGRSAEPRPTQDGMQSVKQTGAGVRCPPNLRDALASVLRTGATSRCTSQTPPGRPRA